jgi:very-short-patch-repair endonuclease
MGFWDSFAAGLSEDPPRRVIVSTRTLREAIENTLIYGFSRAALEVVLPDELDLAWAGTGTPVEADTKRTLIDGHLVGFEIPQLVALARRVLAECDVADHGLAVLIAEYEKGSSGVDSPAKNLIFAANGPKPEMVLRDAVSNDILITKNAEFCLVYDRPITEAGLSFQELIQWWREREAMADTDDRDVGLSLHKRLRESLGENEPERMVLDVYSRRYGEHGFGIPALIPQVYLHYDPYTKYQRKGSSPLERQRMDFLLLFSARKRVVIEVDGRQHYASEDGRANTQLYAEMVTEDRRLRLSGYEVYRFGGKEFESSDAPSMLAAFFDELSSRMK